MNDTIAPLPEPESNTAPRRSKRGLALVIIVVFCAVAFLIFRSTARVPPVMILQDGLPSPRRSFGIVSRLPLRLQQFVYRVKYGVLGPPKAVSLNATIWYVSVPTAASIPFSLGKPEFADTNGLRVWLISTNDLLAVPSAFSSETLFAPRISTAHGIRASMAMTKTAFVNGKQQPVGLTLDCLPYVHSDSIDLAMRLTLTDIVTNQINGGITPTNAAISIQTNCYAALRIQIPHGSGVFIFQENARGSEGRGVMLSASTPRTKK